MMRFIRPRLRKPAGITPAARGRRACALLRLGDLNPGGGANTVR
jgi:hypothetical protein